MGAVWPQHVGLILSAPPCTNKALYHQKSALVLNLFPNILELEDLITGEQTMESSKSKHYSPYFKGTVHQPGKPDP